MDTVILNPPNTGGKVERVWMVVSRDSDGQENLCGSVLGELGKQGLITGNPYLLERWVKPAARLLAGQEQMTGKSIHLLSFTNREELEGWR